MNGVMCVYCGQGNRAEARFCTGCGRGIGNPGELAPGTLLQGRYRIVHRLGRGGNGAVYLADDTRLRRPCVAKELRTDLSGANERRRAEADFEREALILARLSTEHPGLPQTYDFFCDSGRQYLVMQYVAGRDLDARLADGGPLAEAEALRYGAAVADVLAFLHRQQPEPVIHRDIKPGNIIVDPTGRVRLVDFGLAKALPPAALAFEAGGTGQTGAAGTAGYTPLEQWALQAEPRSDVFALGATLHHLLTGRDPRAPFKSAGELNLALIGRLTAFPSARTLRPDLSVALERLLVAMLAPEPAARPASREVQATLEGLLKPGRGRVAAGGVRRAAAPAPAILAVPLLEPEALAAALRVWLHEHIPGFPPGELVVPIAASAVLLPVALASYRVDATFADGAGRPVHRIIADGVCAVDGTGGAALTPALEALLLAARPALATFQPPGPEPAVTTFRVDVRRLGEALAGAVAARHSEQTSYVGGNGRRYTRLCKPRRKDINWEGGAPLLFHYPRWTVRFAVRGREYTLEADQAAPGSAGPALLAAGDAFAEHGFCPACGRLLPQLQLVTCAGCGRSVCGACALRRSRLGIFHKDFCSAACATTFADQSSVLQWL